MLGFYATTCCEKGVLVRYVFVLALSTQSTSNTIHIAQHNTSWPNITNFLYPFKTKIPSTLFSIQTICKCHVYTYLLRSRELIENDKLTHQKKSMGTFSLFDNHDIFDNLNCLASLKLLIFFFRSIVRPYLLKRPSEGINVTRYFGRTWLKR